jgi:general L-amino acid transport system substrate-binding protein
VVIERLEEVVQAYVSGRCDAYTTDVSGLAAAAWHAANPNEHDHPAGGHLQGAAWPADPPWRPAHRRPAALDPLRPDQRRGARDHGGERPAGDHRDNRPEVQRMLGRTGDLGRMLGVDNAFMVNIIRQLGNYGEIFQRNLGPIGLQRGPNALWTAGGLQYGPPFR